MGRKVMWNTEFSIKSGAQKEWGWLVILDLFFTGAGSSAFFFAFVLGALTQMLVGVGLVIVGALFLLADLARPSDAWRVLLRPRTSWISRGALGIIGFLATALSYIFFLSERHGDWGSILGPPWAGGPAWLIGLGMMACVTALFVNLYPGFLLGSMRSIPFWNTMFLPALFLKSGLLCGMGVIFIIPYPWEKEAGSFRVLEIMSLGIVILGLLFLLTYIAVIYFDTNQKTGSPPRGWGFYLQSLAGVIGGGVIVPITILILVFSGLISRSLLPVAGILLAGGMFFLRYSLLRTGVHRTPVSFVMGGSLENE
jgi:formate-dependent nitrite reductase membrane component NrfD